MGVSFCGSLLSLPLHLCIQSAWTRQFFVLYTANLCKAIIWTNSKLMSSTSSQRMVKLSSLISFLVHVLYLCISFWLLLVLNGGKPMSAFVVSAEHHYPWFRRGVERSTSVLFLQWIWTWSMSLSPTHFTSLTLISHSPTLTSYPSQKMKGRKERKGEKEGRRKENPREKDSVPWGEGTHLIFSSWVR